MIKYCIYCHASTPPVGIQIGQWYRLDELKERFSLEYITQFFSGANFGWEECEEIYPKKEKTEAKQNKTK